MRRRDRFSISSSQLADLGRNLIPLMLATGWLGRTNHARLCRARFNARRVAPPFHEAGKSNPSPLVRDRGGKNVAMRPPRRSRKPRSKAMLGPPRRSKQNGAGTLYEQHAQIPISAFGDAAKDRTITRRHLIRHQTKPSSKTTPFRKGGPIADRGYHRA